MQPMGIRIEPPNPDNENALFLKINGIEKAVPWAEDLNGIIFKCIHIGVYDFYKELGLWAASIIWSPTNTNITVSLIETSQIAYRFMSGSPYQYYGENNITNPLARWHNGSHIVSYSSMSLQPGSFQAQAAQVGAGDFPKLFAEPISGGSANRTVRFARRNDRTCIYIKQE